MRINEFRMRNVTPKRVRASSSCSTVSTGVDGPLPVPPLNASMSCIDVSDDDTACEEQVVAAPTRWPPGQRAYGTSAEVIDLSGDAVRPTMDRSVAQQIDGLCYSLLRLRVERDVFADKANDAVCAVFGCPAYLSWGSFTGWFLPSDFDRKTVHAMIHKASKDRACGVFILPLNEGDSWYEVCNKARLLTFFFPVSCLSAQSQECRGVVAVVANFGFIGRIKANRRPERILHVWLIASPRGGDERFCISTLPRLVTRSSEARLGSPMFYGRVA